MKTLKYIMKTSAQKIFNVKFATFCAAFLILSWTYDQPYLQFVKEKNYPISWCIFPFYMSSFGILSIFYVGIVYIHSDVPFMQHINMYQVIRTGRERWAPENPETTTKIPLFMGLSLILIFIYFCKSPGNGLRLKCAEHQIIVACDDHCFCLSPLSCINQ